MNRLASPTISVVVPLFNKAPYIGRCLESIRAQTVRDFEAIVIDDGSTDGSGDIARGGVDTRFRVITQTNQGEGAARNRGIAEASADLVAFLDADDEWSPEFLHAVLALRQRYPEAGIFATGYRRLFGNGLETQTTVKSTDGSGSRLLPNYFAAAREGPLVTSSSAAVPLKILQEMGRFVENEPIGADVDMWARISMRYPVACDARILATYHSESEGRSFELWRERPPYPPVVRTLRRILADYPLSSAVKREIASYADWRLMSYAYWLLDLGEASQLADMLQHEQFTTVPYRVESAMLRAALRFLPSRLVRALRWKPERLYRQVRALLPGDNDSRRYVLCREVAPEKTKL